MTTKDTALRLALEALEQCGSNSCALEKEAIAACREALAQPAGETLSEDQSVLVDKLKALLTGPANLTTQEAGAVSDAIRALLSSDAQPSEWVGLSDDLIDEILEAEAAKPEFKGSWSMYSFARAIEAKLKEKNHGK